MGIDKSGVMRDAMILNAKKRERLRHLTYRSPRCACCVLFPTGSYGGKNTRMLSCIGFLAGSP
jgi:hypothetical protein